ncbi:unnamed protein product [Sphagnum balticum]
MVPSWWTGVQLPSLSNRFGPGGHLGGHWKLEAGSWLNSKFTFFLPLRQGPGKTLCPCPHRGTSPSKGARHLVLERVFVSTRFGRMAGDQPKTVKWKSKKEKGKAPTEPELAPPNGKKSKRVTTKRKAPREEEPHEEEPIYEEGPLETRVKTLHIASSATFDTTPPQEVDEDKERGDGEEEEAAMDEANEEQQEEGKTRSRKSCSKYLTSERRGTSKHSPWELYNERRRE